MKEKDTYTANEVEDIVVNAVKLNDAYTSLVKLYNDQNAKTFREYERKNINKLVNLCNQKLPKSLITKLGIKTIE
ncbi:MAG: hypothetical protein WC812_02280 [Candidatus Pacearchaeota archaeon]|jgi:hypothetical protein